MDSASYSSFKSIQPRLEVDEKLSKAIDTILNERKVMANSILMQRSYEETMAKY